LLLGHLLKCACIGDCDSGVIRKQAQPGELFGGGPTPDKPTVTLSVPDPNHINSFMNFRVADIQACYELWKSRGAEFITEPIPKYGETRCYIRDPDGYIIEVGQSTDLTYG
jgi:catechol 2,3-dioxygenase-like lactoylglutathione lyase family enzyme